MTARRWLAASAIVAAAALALSACTTIPNSGPVNEGSGVVSSSEPFVPIAEGPRVGDDPTAIVNGFINATSAGFASDFTVAREYLGTRASATWDPNEQVTIFDSGALTASFDDVTNTVTYDVGVKATLDDSGRLTEAADGTRATLTFQMAKDADGEWRISSLNNGAIIAGATFEQLFTDVSLIFASVDETVQVPELRWLPINKAATLAARELVEGPSPKLADAVHTGFPATSGLEVDSVVVTNGVAKVQLTAASAGDAADRALAQEQMLLTLKSVGGISGVSVTVGGLPLGGDDSVDLQPAPLPSTDAAAFVGGRLGMWDGTDVWRVGDDVGGLPAGSTGLAQSFGEPSAVWLVDRTRLVTSQELAAGASGLVEATDDDEPATDTMDTKTLYEGTDLVAPSVDRHGWAWTANGDGGSGIVAVKQDGTVATMAADWLRGTTVQAISVSRDGARIAVLSQASGKQVLEVASVVRGDDGAPLTIGEPQAFGADLGPSIDLAWLDELTVAVLGEPGDGIPNDLWLVEVGGLTTSSKSVTGGVDITARQGERTLVVVDDQTGVFTRSGTAWSQVAKGPTELAFSG